MGDKTAKVSRKSSHPSDTLGKKSGSHYFVGHIDKSGKVGLKLEVPTLNEAAVAYDSTQYSHTIAIGGKAILTDIFAPPANPEIEEAKLARKLVTAVEKSGPDVKTLCDEYGLKREELGRLTGFSLRALAEWVSGNLPSQPAQRRLHEVRRLLDALAEIVQPGEIPQWLHKPNPAFAPLTPLQVIELGEIDRLWAMVHALGSGQPQV